MGLLNIFSKSDDTGHMTRLFSGSFTVDAEGQVIASTLPRSFPELHVHEIGEQVLNAFHGAKNVGLPLNEVVLHFSAMKITARELRGGAIIFLAPETTK